MSLLRIYIHAVWAVKYRDALLSKEIKPMLVDSIHGLLAFHGHRPIITNCEPDHVHTLFRYMANQQHMGELMKAVKGGSSRTINEAFFDPARPFRFQGGYGAFSVCPTHVAGKAQYIRDQEIIHQQRRWDEEYFEMISACPPEDLDPGIEAENEPFVTYFEGLVDRE